MVNESENLNDCKLRQAHCDLHWRYNLMNEKEVMMRHIELVKELERRGLRHKLRDKLDRLTTNVIMKKRRKKKRN